MSRYEATKERREDDIGPRGQLGGATMDREDLLVDIAKRAAALQERFAPWFFVISDSSFKTIHKQRDDLFKEE